jgi:hypothetical protein
MVGFPVLSSNKDPANLLCQLNNRSELVAELWVEQPFT